MAQFVKGQKRPARAGWKPETREKRKKMHEIFDDAFYKAGGINRLNRWVSASTFC